MFHCVHYIEMTYITNIIDLLQEYPQLYIQSCFMCHKGNRSYCGFVALFECFVFFPTLLFFNWQCFILPFTEWSTHPHLFLWRIEPFKEASLIVHHATLCSYLWTFQPAECYSHVLQNFLTFSFSLVVPTLSSLKSATIIWYIVFVLFSFKLNVKKVLGIITFCFIDGFTGSPDYCTIKVVHLSVE